tara:strand:- start:679 stop:1245 length:567 start_codon:yes stop_codon:yes gene_type:complete
MDNTNNTNNTNNDTNCQDIERIQELPVSYLVEVNSDTSDDDIQYAVQYNHIRVIPDRKLLLTINKLTTMLSLFNLIYIFDNIFLYIMRVGFMMTCQYFGVFKGCLCITNTYIGGVLVNMFFIRPILLAGLYNDNKSFILLNEIIQIPFESMLLIKINILRKKLKENEEIPIAQHNNDDIPLAITVLPV